MVLLLSLKIHNHTDEEGLFLTLHVVNACDIPLNNKGNIYYNN